MAGAGRGGASQGDAGTRLPSRSKAEGAMNMRQAIDHRWLGGKWRPVQWTLRPAACALIVAACMCLSWSAGGAGASSTSGQVPPAVCALEPPGGPVSDLAALVGTSFRYTVPSGVDAVTGDVTHEGSPHFYPHVQNASSSAVTDPTITFASGYSPSVFDGGLPTTTLPSSCSLPTLPAGEGMGISPPTLTAYAVQDPYTLGFNSSRTVTPDSVPAGGGNVQVQIAVTPTSPRFAHGAAITVALPETSWGVGVSVVALTGPANLNQGETLSTSASPAGWNLQGALLTKTYTFMATLAVAAPSDAINAGFASVTVFSNVGTTPTGCSGACSTPGPSVTIPIPMLDGPVPGSGSVTFSVAQTNHSWSVGQQLSEYATYGALPQATVSGTVTEPGGAPFPSPSAVTVGAAACPAGESLSTSANTATFGCPGLAQVLVNPNGSYSVNLDPGSYNVVGFAQSPSGAELSPPVPLTLTSGEAVTESFVLPIPTATDYTGPLQGAVGDPVLVSATLISWATGNPVGAGQTIRFSIGSASCSATTNSTGSASCILVPPGPPGPNGVGATFAGNSQYAPSGIKPTFTVLGSTCTLCVLSPTASPALSLTGNGSVTVQGAVAVDSTGNPAASLTGNARITGTQIGGPGAPSTFKVTGNAKFSPAPVAQSAVSDPLAALPECPGAGTPDPCPTTVRANVALTGNGSATISAGIYQSISVTGNGKLTLNPGTYVVTGSLTETGNGSITGNGVTLYFACSAYPAPCASGQPGASFSVTGNGTVSLSAPTSGPFPGVSIFVERNDSATDTLTGNGATIGGTVYAASGNLTLTGNGNMVIGRLIVNTLSVTGNGSVTIG